MTLTHPQLVRPMFEYSSIVSLAKDKVYCPRYCGLSMYQVFIFLLCSTNLMSELASKFRFLNLNKTQFVNQKLKTLLGGLHFRNKDLVTSAAKQVVIYTLVTFQPFPAIGKIVLLLLGNFRCNFCYLHKFQYFPVLGVTERKEKCFALL